MTTSSQLLNEDEQEEKTSSLEQTTKNEDKMKVTEVCNDEMDNDLDGIIDEEHECILQTSDIRVSNEKIVPELATIIDTDKEEEKEKEDNQKKNIQDEENEKNEDQLQEGSKLSNNKNNIIEEEQTSLIPGAGLGGVEIISGEEICNDEMDNDLDGIIDEKKDCIDK